MKTIYYPDDDILELHFSDNPIVKETAQDWNVVLSYDANNHLVQMVILEASATGLLPVQEKKSRLGMKFK